MATVLEVSQLGKLYRIPRVVDSAAPEQGGARPPWWGRRGGRLESVWALRDVSFAVAPGEVVGVIGRNGAGKSTLLKILARIVSPSTGRAELRGRVGSLLEVGTGFHPELTGRENIYLSGAILGMRRAEIRRAFDAIVEFAEIARFLDTPVKRYSSGMYVRLAFAVAAHLDPEILLVDEVLAVGDVQFQRKCLGKMGDVARSGRTILFVSHNLVAVEGLCQRGLVLESGQLVFDGPVPQALGRYVAALERRRGMCLAGRTDRQGSGVLRFTDVRFLADGVAGTTCRTGQDLRLELDFAARRELRDVSISVPFFTRIGQPAFLAWTRMLGRDFARLPRQGTIVLEIPRLPLRGGIYCINAWCEAGGELADWVQDAARLDVLDGDYFGTGRTPPAGYGMFVVDHSFRCEEAGVVCEPA